MRRLKITGKLARFIALSIYPIRTQNSSAIKNTIFKYSVLQYRKTLRISKSIYNHIGRVTAGVIEEKRILTKDMEKRTRERSARTRLTEPTEGQSRPYGLRRTNKADVTDKHAFAVPWPMPTQVFTRNDTEEDAPPSMSLPAVWMYQRQLKFRLCDLQQLHSSDDNLWKIYELCNLLLQYPAFHFSTQFYTAVSVVFIFP